MLENSDFSEITDRSGNLGPGNRFCLSKTTRLHRLSGWPPASATSDDAASSSPTLAHRLCSSSLTMSKRADDKQAIFIYLSIIHNIYISVLMSKIPLNNNA
jgi:hypothetical protein